ncbi:MAG: DNA polymerase III subunit gamma/tau [Elusimicrobiaceae bacterium]|nr:DNA polymerase III subunit gamma/tau [Elusimicrobiaceae bacterium]
MAETQHINLARKYRPMTFEDVVGQGAISKTLENSLRLGRIAHAYLFHGPRGCGKTTSARILAKALNCTGGGAEKPVVSPCGKCPQCLEIAAGSDMDVLEIDAASNTQVEKVREVIIDTVSLSAGRDRYKVFILDEVHMLSDASFNALLKTIEEPPPHVVFILATTEHHKVPVTITSRCQGFRFKTIGAEDIFGRLKFISGKEKFDIEDAALALIAKAANGALRDAQTLLDRAVSYAPGHVSAQLVGEMLGYMPAELVEMACAALLAGDGGKLHDAFETVRREGYDPAAFLRDLKAGLAELFYFRLGYGKPPFDGAAELVKAAPPAFLAGFVRRVGKISDEVRFSDMPLVQAETGLFTVMQAVPDFEGMVRRLETLESRLASGNFKHASAPETAAASSCGRAEGEAAVSKQAAEPPSGSAAPASAAGSEPVFRPGPAEEAETDRGLADGTAWKKLLDTLAEGYPLLYEIMSKCRVALGPNEWNMVFSTRFQLDAAERNAERLNALAAEAAGRALRLKFSFGEAVQKPHVEEIVSEPVSDCGTQLTEEAPFVEGQYHWEDLAGGSAAATEPALARLLKIIPGKVVRPESGGDNEKF